MKKIFPFNFFIKSKEINKIKQKMCNPNPLREIGREKIKEDRTQLDKKLAGKRLTPNNLSTKY